MAAAANERHTSGSVRTCRCAVCRDVRRRARASGLNRGQGALTMTGLGGTARYKDGGIPFFRKGTRCVLTGNRSGIIRWCGFLDSAYVQTQIFVGVHLDEPIGNHDGIMQNKRYFKCPAGHGVFVPKRDVLLVKGRNDLHFHPADPLHSAAGTSTSPSRSLSRTRSQNQGIGGVDGVDSGTYGNLVGNNGGGYVGGGAGSGKSSLHTGFRSRNNPYHAAMMRKLREAQARGEELVRRELGAADAARREAEAAAEAAARALRPDGWDTIVEVVVGAQFEAADMRGDGTIDPDRLEAILLAPRLSLGIKPAQASKIVSRAKRDGDGRVLWQQLVPTFRNRVAAAVAAKQGPPDRAPWSEIYVPDDNTLVYYDKVSGNVTTEAPSAGLGCRSIYKPAKDEFGLLALRAFIAADRTGSGQLDSRGVRAALRSPVLDLALPADEETVFVQLACGKGGSAGTLGVFMGAARQCLASKHFAEEPLLSGDWLPLDSSTFGTMRFHRVTGIAEDT